MDIDTVAEVLTGAAGAAPSIVGRMREPGLIASSEENRECCVD
jgi:hypothetical protein